MIKNAHNVAAFRRRKAQKGQVRLEAYIHKDDVSIVKELIKQLNEKRNGNEKV